MFYDPNGCLTAPVTIKNFGQTPAYDFMCSLQIGFFRYPLDVPLDVPTYLPTASKSPIAPGEHVTQYTTLPDRLNQAETDSIRSGTGAIFVWGELLYLDVLKKRQSTQFSLYSTGDDFRRGELAYYHEGNKAT